MRANGEAHRLILWTGPKHSGKTTSALRLIDKLRSEGFLTAGIAAVALRDGERLLGYDIIDLRSGLRRALARPGAPGPPRIGRFGFLWEGLTLGERALSPNSIAGADLVLIDEFGPLELRGEGWRRCSDRIVRQARGVVVLVVRDSLLEQASALYRLNDPLVVAAGGPAASETVITAVVARREVSNAEPDAPVTSPSRPETPHGS